jgi:hypothetical protein
MKGDNAMPSSRRAQPKWYGPSTWLALGIVLLYWIFSFLLPLIPIAITAGSMGYWVPPLAFAGWAAAMFIRTRGRKMGTATIIWTCVRYAVISAGTTGFLVMLFASATPGYIRATAQFHREMKKTADIEAIRAWAISYQPSADDAPTLWGSGVFVAETKWPRCIAELQCQMVQFTTDDRVVHIIFGGGFGHWGLSVGPKGTEPYGDYVKGLKDGAWVWHEIQ